jgi:FG-GAP-like repeat
MFLIRSFRHSPKPVTSRREFVRHARLSWLSGATRLEERVLLSGLPPSEMADATPIAIGSPTSGNLASGGADIYQIQPSQDGRLIALTSTSASGLELQLSLYDSLGDLLVESDGQSGGKVNPIDYHVDAGAAYLEVQSLAGSGAFSLAMGFTPASDPNQTMVLPPEFQGTGFTPIAAGDFTNNGIEDIVTPAGIYLGTGDGTFQAPSATGALVDPANFPTAITTGYFTSDQNLDVAVALALSDSVSISMGNGDGTFQPAINIPLLSIAGTPYAIVAGDFGNGQTDLAVTVPNTGNPNDDVVVLMNNGDGGFTQSNPIPVGLTPVAIASGSFGSDGNFLAVADEGTSDVTILTNQNGGSFVVQQTIQFPSDVLPSSVVAGNFGNGQVDLAVTDAANNVVYILQGNGNGTFQPQPVETLPVGFTPNSIVAGDFGNGQLDLAVADQGANAVSVLMGNGDGTFQPVITSPTTGSAVINSTGVASGTGPADIVAADFNGDGRLDVATGNAGSSDISVLLGKVDGTFEEPPGTSVGTIPIAMATGDFTGNGSLGVAVLEQDSDSVTILPGNGDGTFQQSLLVPLPAGSGASAIVAGDFNNDGRLSLAVADTDLDEFSILLGNGDGTFESSTVALPQSVSGPTAIAAGDFTGNGVLDLAVVDRYSSSVTILLNNGFGQFTVGQTIQLVNPANPSQPGVFPDAIVAGNFTSNGDVGLVVAEPFIDAVTVLLGNGNGTFTQGSTVAFGDNPAPTRMVLVAGDFRNDGLTDVAIASTNPAVGDTVDVLLGNGDGTFQSPDVISLGDDVDPFGIVAADFTGNGILDLATADGNGNGTEDYSVLMGNGDGAFQPLVPLVPYALGGSGGYSTAIAAGDLTGNGLADLIITRTNPDGLTVQLSNGNGTFTDPSVDDLVRRQTPLVADVTGDGADDVIVVDAAGDILYRAGIPGEPGVFSPPVTVNPGDPSRDIAFAVTNQGRVLISVDADDNNLSFFALRSTGFVKVATLPTGPEPAQILAADLDANGFTSLIVRNAGDGTISIFPGDGHGWFAPRIDLPVGLGASDVEVADLQQDGRLDILYTDRLSGEVGVLENLGGGAFSSPIVFPAGAGPYGETGTPVPSPVTSFEQTTSITAGIFTTGGAPSIVALNPGSDTFGELAGTGDGRFADPTIFPTPGNPLVVRAINFGTDGLAGLAILTSDGLFIERSNGDGGFLAPTEINVGFEPNGLTVADLTGNGDADLLVSNPRGDVQVLIGDGTGSFQPPQNLDQQVSLAVYATSGTAPAAFIYSDQLTDQLIVQTVGGGTTILGSAGTGLVTPGAVTLADLSGNGILDLIVANSGSNNVYVYMGLGNGTFSTTPLNDGDGYFTGTNPVGITVADLTGNGRLDLIIANEGSNNVSTLINEPGPDGEPTFVEGPTFAAGVGPVATALLTLPGQSVPDLLIADSDSNQVLLLQGLGNGFFNDQSPTVYSVGTDPTQLLLGDFSSGGGLGLVTVNSGSDNLTLISGVGTGSATSQTISSGGIDPTSAIAVPFSGNGLDNLVVSNNADGNISLFEAGDNGLSLSSVISSSGLPNPSALALASFSNSGMEFYATNDGEASASVLGFQLEESSAVSTASASGASASLVSLNESSLALLGTMLTISLETTSNEMEGGVEAGAAAPAGGSGGAGQSLYGRTSSDDVLEMGDMIAIAVGNLAPQSSWAKYVTGVDQAIERVRSEADARLLQEQQPAKTEQPGTSFLEEDDGAGQKSAAAFVKEAALEAGRRIKARQSLMDAIDVAIGSWKIEQLPAVRSPLPNSADSEIARRATPEAQFVEPVDRAAMGTRLDDDQLERSATQPSRLAVATLIYLTAASSREILVRRSKRDPAPEVAARWQCLIRERGNSVNRQLVGWSKRRRSTEGGPAPRDHRS